MRDGSDNASREIDAKDIAALRKCVASCWLNRATLKLLPADVDQVLIAWMAVGTPEEGHAAAELLAARREADRKQAEFDGMLGE